MMGTEIFQFGPGKAEKIAHWKAKVKMILKRPLHLSIAKK